MAGLNQKPQWLALGEGAEAFNRCYAAFGVAYREAAKTPAPPFRRS